MDTCCRYIICVHTVQIDGIYVRKVQQQHGTSAALRQARQKNVELERLVRIHIYIYGYVDGPCTYTASYRGWPYIYTVLDRFTVYVLCVCTVCMLYTCGIYPHETCSSSTGHQRHCGRSAITTSSSNVCCVYHFHTVHETYTVQSFYMYSLLRIFYLSSGFRVSWPWTQPNNANF